MAIYFASDFHLGFDSTLSSKQREKKIIEWIDHISNDMKELYILGDMFDYWFEYKNVVPKGHVRLLAKIGEVVERGIPVHIFTGNHDMWMFGYLEDELNVKVHRKVQSVELQNKKLLIGHGDGLGPGDKGYKIMKRIFSNRFNQWLFSKLHPDIAIQLMKYSSRKSRETDKEAMSFLGPDKEWLILYAEQKLKSQFYDYFIFGHRHLPIDYTLSNSKSRYINTGDWIDYYTYARMENGHISLEKYKITDE
jgi:UDP-2,3-diacylglucosamine hydrolase